MKELFGNYCISRKNVRITFYSSSPIFRALDTGKEQPFFKFSEGFITMTKFLTNLLQKPLLYDNKSHYPLYNRGIVKVN